VIVTVLVDTNGSTARLRERSPLATSYAKHLFGQRIALAPQTVAEARYGALSAGWGTARVEREPTTPTCGSRRQRSAGASRSSPTTRSSTAAPAWNSEQSSTRDPPTEQTPQRSARRPIRDRAVN
jgi:hypothetical protein